MAITRFDPFREFTTLQDRMNRLFGDIYLRDEDVSGRSGWVPPVDIYETDNHDLVVKAELPDLTREDIEVTVENNTLTIRGERKLPGDVKEGQVVTIDFADGATKLALNGQSKGEVAGDAFNQALMRVWIGDKPVQGELKRGMLGDGR